jgi:ketosteroid isomerase-like protein
MKAAIYSLTILLSVSIQAQTDTARVKQLLDEINRSLDRAIVKKDVDYMQKHFADDFFFYHATGMIDSKESWIGKNKNPNNKMLSREHDSVTVELHGDVAILKGTLTVLFPPEAKRAGYAVRYIRVFANRKNLWQLISHHSTAQWSK